PPRCTSATARRNRSGRGEQTSVYYRSTISTTVETIAVESGECFAPESGVPARDQLHDPSVMTNVLSVPAHPRRRRDRALDEPADPLGATDHALPRRTERPHARHRIHLLDCDPRRGGGKRRRSRGAGPPLPPDRPP